MTAIRYIFIQLLAYGIDLGGFLLIFDGIHSSPIAANVASKSAAGLFAFIAHRHFTFSATSEAMVGQASRYALLLLLNIPLSSGLFLIFLYLVPLSEPMLKVFADVACVAITYCLSAKLVFRHAVAARAEDGLK